MTDIQPDYTPFLNLVRPDLHDDVDATINKIRDAIDAIDAWAQTQGSVAVTALVSDGSDYHLAAGVRYLLVDADAVGMNVFLPPLAAGLVVTVVKRDTNLSNGVFVVPNNPDTEMLDGQVDNYEPIENPYQSIEFVCDGTAWWSSGIGIGFANPMLGTMVPRWNDSTHRFEGGQIEIENLTGVFMAPPFVDGEVVTWDGTFNHWVKRAIPAPPPPPPPSLDLDDLTDVQFGTRHDHEMLQFNSTDGKWENVEPSALPWSYPTAVFTAGSPSTFGDIDLTGALRPNFPSVFVIDATIRANVTLPAAAVAFDPENLWSAVVTLKKIDGTANPVHVIPNGSEKIDGAANLDITTRWESRTLVTDGANWFTI